MLTDIFEELRVVHGRSSMNIYSRNGERRSEEMNITFPETEI